MFSLEKRELQEELRAASLYVRLCTEVRNGGGETMGMSWNMSLNKFRLDEKK